MGDRNPDFVLFADHEPARHVAGYFNLRDVFNALVIDIGEEQQDQVIYDQSHLTPGAPQAKTTDEEQRQNAEREKNEEEAMKII